MTILNSVKLGGVRVPEAAIPIVPVMFPFGLRSTSRPGYIFPQLKVPLNKVVLCPLS
jgi:hypothetical protein